MDMQDKEFDRLFHDKLDDLEIEPSANVWQGITGQLDAGKRKRTIVPFLSIAAGIILLVTIGVLFIPKPAKVSNQQPVIAKAIQAVKPQPIIAAVSVKPAIASQNKKAVRPVIAPVNRLARIAKPNINKASSPDKQAPAIDIKPDVIQPNNQATLAAANTNTRNDVLQPVVPDTATHIVIKQVVDDDAAFKTKPPVMAAVPAKAVATPAKKHRIRSFGDVLNVVIAAVDKRKDKVIEFSNTDEDDATITGINFGIIKVKKEK